MEDDNSFGQWLKRQRRQLDMTQQQLADCAACSVITIRKFETGERRPSRALAELLATCLAVATHEQESFIAFARGLQTTFSLTKLVESQAPLPQHSSAAFRTNLPIPATPFIGRTAELTQIDRMLADPDCHLLTLVGPGGMGKTRLALAAAAAHHEQFADGVIFVSLTAVTDPAHIPQAIAHNLNITLTGGLEPAVQLGNVLQNKQCLLVLDNFEQVVDGAELLAMWLSQAPQTRWLVTSRERLNLAQEWLMHIQGFADNDPGPALFVQSARRVQPDFVLAGQETATAQICQYVGGLPLAIELAAGWTAVLSCEQILSQMQQTFDFLSTSLRNVPQRHRSLRHLFDQTWRLLSPAEQAVLSKLSVFRGGFALDEAMAVAKATLPLLRTLTNKSLVLAGGNGRYDLHELMRQYAAEKLQERGEETAVNQHHLQTFLALAETANPQLYGADAALWFQRLDDEHDNFRAALAWSITREASELMLKLTHNLWWFWFRRGYWQEAERWLMAAATTETADTPLRCQVLLHLSTVIALQGRYGEATPYLMQGWQMAQRLEDPESLVAALTIFGQAMPDIAQAMPQFVEAETIWQHAGDPQKPWILAHLYNLMGDRLRDNGRYDEAAAYYEQSLALYRGMGNMDHIAYPLGNLGRLALHNGHLAEAVNLIGKSVSLSRQLNQRQGVADWLIPLAWAMLYQGQLARAETCLQESWRQHQETNNLRGQVQILTPLAYLALLQNNPDRAGQYLQNSLQIYRQTVTEIHGVMASLSSVRDMIAPDLVDTFYVAGLIAAEQANEEHATRLFALADHLGHQIGHQPDMPLRERVATVQTAVYQSLAPAEHETASILGQDWSTDEIIQFALS